MQKKNIFIIIYRQILRSLKSADAVVKHIVLVRISSKDSQGLKT